MNKQIALNIEQMQHLQELGLDCSGASMHWQYILTADNIMGKDDSEELALFISGDYKMEHCYPAFCLQDILELLPIKIREYELSSDCQGYIAYIDLVSSDDEEDGTNRYIVEKDIFHAVCCKELIISAYDMLCWCIENGYIKTKYT